jgi:protein-disulfide isomerase
MRLWIVAVAAVYLALSVAPPLARAETTGGAVSQAGDSAGAAALSAEQERAIKKLVRDYLLSNPEIIVDAVGAMRRKQRREESARAKAALKTYSAAIFDDPLTPVIGNPDGDVTIVEFFDYQCGYCKKVFPALMQTVKKDGNVRLALKEFPILGAQSRFASEAALASRRQGKYAAFHVALMKARGALSEAKVMAVARSVGLDTKRLRKDMRDPEVQALLEKNFKLAEALNIRGTPAFVIGDELVPGAVGIERLKSMVAKARSPS